MLSGKGVTMRGWYLPSLLVDCNSVWAPFRCSISGVACLGGLLVVQVECPLIRTSTKLDLLSWLNIQSLIDPKCSLIVAQFWSGALGSFPSAAMPHLRLHLDQQLYDFVPIFMFSSGPQPVLQPDFPTPFCWENPMGSDGFGLSPRSIPVRTDWTRIWIFAGVQQNLAKSRWILPDR